MKVTELRDKNINELRQLLIDQKKEQLMLRMAKGMGEAPKSSSTRELRRNVARINTIINEMKRSGNHE
jgi:large subunit ribosomal protein L29